MAGLGRLGAVWPLLDLVVRTSRLEVRSTREDEFPDLVALVDQGIHDPIDGLEPCLELFVGSASAVEPPTPATP